MLDRTQACFGLKPRRLSADKAYGSAEILAWMVEEKNIAPHVPVWDKSERTDGTFSRSDFIFDAGSNTYTCPGGKTLQPYRRPFTIPRAGVTKNNMRLYRARQSDCEACALKARCCPGQPRRKVPRSVHEAAREVARGFAGTPEYLQSRRERKKVEMLFAHLNASSGSIDFVCAAHRAPRTSFCSPRSHRTYASWPCWSNRSRRASYHRSIAREEPDGRSANRRRPTPRVQSPLEPQQPIADNAGKILAASTSSTKSDSKAVRGYW